MQKELSPEAPIELTEREQEILKLLATGTSNKEIARELVISSNTVKVHLRNIFAKIGVTSRTEAAMYAVRTRLVEGPVPFPTGQGADGEEANSQQPPAPKATGLTRWLWALLAGILVITSGSVIFFLTQRNPGVPSANFTALPTFTPMPRWKLLAEPITARQRMAAIVYEGIVYVIGGEADQVVIGEVESYDAEANHWQKKTSKPLAVMDVSAAIIGGRIYVPGGQTAAGKMTDALEIYDPRQDRWEEGPRMPAAISAYALVAFEGRIYLFGGWNGTNYLNSVYIYDPSRDSWSTGTPMPTKRAFACGSVIEGKIFVIGGFDGTNALTANEVYSPDREHSPDSPWQSATGLPDGRYASGCASLTDMIYLIGGRGDTEGPTLPLLYNPQADLWGRYDEPPEPVGVHPGLVSLGNKLYVIDGKHALTYQATFTIVIPIVTEP